MKRIQKLIGRERVFLNVEAEDRVSALHQVAEKLGRLTSLDTQILEHSLEERERLGSTSVGSGFAIPHAKLRGLEDIVVILVRFSRELLFEHAKPVRMVAAVVSPPDQPAAHLQVLSQIARLLKHAEFCQELIEAPSEEDVIDVLEMAAAREGL